MKAKAGTKRDNELCVGLHEVGQRNENGDLFVDICLTFDLLMGGTSFIHKRIHKLTWVLPNGITENQIEGIHTRCS